MSEIELFENELFFSIFYNVEEMYGKSEKKIVSPISFILNGELALISKISLTKLEVHRVKGLRETAEKNFHCLCYRE